MEGCVDVGGRRDGFTFAFELRVEDAGDGTVDGMGVVGIDWEEDVPEANALSFARRPVEFEAARIDTIKMNCEDGLNKFHL